MGVLCFYSDDGLGISHAVFIPVGRLVGIGMSVWTLSTFLSGLSKYINRYEFLVLARMLR